MDPFEYFDEIRCVNLDADAERWRLMQARFTTLRLGDRARRFAAVATPANRRIGQALSHRRVVEEAAERGRRSVLIIEDDVRFFDQTIAILSAAVPELSGLDWTTCHLGGCRWDGALQAAPDCRYWFRVLGLIATPAVAYSERAFAPMLQGLAADVSGMGDWIRAHHTINQHLQTMEQSVALRPPVAVSPKHLPYEDPATRHLFAA